MSSETDLSKVYLDVAIRMKNLLTQALAGKNGVNISVLYDASSGLIKRVNEIRPGIFLRNDCPKELAETVYFIEGLRDSEVRRYHQINKETTLPTYIQALSSLSL